MVPIAELRTAAATVLSQVPGLTVEPLVKHRGRRDGMGGLYYGGHYFNHMDVADERPELHLTRSMPRATVRLVRDGGGTDCFSVWVGGYGDLRNLVKKPSRGICDWSFFSFCFLDHEGHVAVFLSNRGGTFGHALAEAANIRCLWSCSALREGREPDLRV